MSSTTVRSPSNAPTVHRHRYVFAGVISGSGAVQQIGTGTVELSAANTYSGGTIISDGTVRVTNSDPGTSSSVGTGTVTLDGGKFQAGANNLDFSNTFEVNTTGGTVDTNGNTLTHFRHDRERQRLDRRSDQERRGHA